MASKKGKAKQSLSMGGILHAGMGTSNAPMPRNPIYSAEEVTHMLKDLHRNIRELEEKVHSLANALGGDFVPRSYDFRKYGI